MRVAALDRALAGAAATGPRSIAQIRAIVGELFDLIATTRVAADAMERSARDAPDLGELFYRRVRVRLLDQLVEYCARVDAVRPLPAAAHARARRRDSSSRPSRGGRVTVTAIRRRRTSTTRRRARSRSALVAGALLSPTRAMKRRALAAAVGRPRRRVQPATRVGAGSTPATRHSDVDHRRDDRRSSSRAALDAIAYALPSGVQVAGGGASACEPSDGATDYRGLRPLRARRCARPSTASSSPEA